MTKRPPRGVPGELLVKPRAQGEWRFHFIPKRTDPRVVRVLEEAEKRQSTGQVAFEQQFGIKHTDRSYDLQLEAALYDAVSKGKPAVLPVETALALWLRAKRPKAGRPPLRDLTDVMLQAARYAAGLKGPSGKDGKKLTAEQRNRIAAKKFYKETDLNEERFYELMTRPAEWAHHPMRRRR